MRQIKAIKREKRRLKNRHAPKGGTAAGQRARTAAAKGYRRISKKTLASIKISGVV